MGLTCAEVERLWWDEFKRYFELADEHLFKNPPAEDESEQKQLAHLQQLRLHFLFPNLTDAERGRLFNAICVQDALQLVVSVLRDPDELMDAEHRTELERHAVRTEHQLLDMWNQFVASSTAAKLSELQMQILKERVFRVHFPERQTRQPSAGNHLRPDNERQ